VNKKVLISTLLAAAGALVLGSAVALAAGAEHFPGGRGEPAGFFSFELLGGLASLLFLAVIVILVIFVIRALTGSSSLRKPVATAAAAETPLEILARRFAAGEISAEDYQKARDVLSQPPKA
jgi:uncharacterized membrane protein